MKNNILVIIAVAFLFTAIGYLALDNIYSDSLTRMNQKEDRQYFPYWEGEDKTYMFNLDESAAFFQYKRRNIHCYDYYFNRKIKSKEDAYQCGMEMFQIQGIIPIDAEEELFQIYRDDINKIWAIVQYEPRYWSGHLYEEPYSLLVNDDGIVLAVTDYTMEYLE